MKVLSFGEVLWDVYPNEKYLGGAPLNFAAHLSMHGVDSYMLSAVGNDDLGDESINLIQSFGVNTDFVSKTSNASTGKCVVTLDKSAVPTYNLLKNVAYDYIDFEDFSQKFDVLYFGTLALRSVNNVKTVKKLMNIGFCDVFVDVNIRPPFYSAYTAEFAVSCATILKISIEELPTVASLLGESDFGDYKKFAKRLSQKYNKLKCIIITLGKMGAYAFDCKTLDEFFAKAVDVKVVSTVGAGDSFSAAFLYNYYRGKDVDYCLNYANRVAGYVVSKQEAIPKYNPKEI